jgi:hypothetical protein
MKLKKKNFFLKNPLTTEGFCAIIKTMKGEIKMSHKTKKTEEKRKHRGPTFVGFAPRVEDTKKGKLRKAERKHKKAYLPY